MKYSVLFLLIHCILFSEVRSQDTANVYYWNKERRLTFSDFRGKPDSSKALSDVNSDDYQGAAVISTSIILDYQILNDKVLFKIYAAMQRNNSWFKILNDSACLRHEQGHFDICEIHARILRKKISKLKSWADVKAAYRETLKEEELVQKKFDEDNTYLYKGVRKRWAERIAKWLDELYPFRNENVLATIVE